MVARKRRRVRPKAAPNKKLSSKPVVRKPDVDWRGGALKTAIGIVIAINAILLFFFIRQCSVPKEPEPLTEEWTGPIQIEVLNGCGVPNIANDWTRFLRANGFDVVRTDNYESFSILETVIIDRRGNIENAIQVARAMGLPDIRVLQEINDTYLLDVSVILGKDYRTLSGWHAMETFNGPE